MKKLISYIIICIAFHSLQGCIWNNSNGGEVTPYQYAYTAVTMDRAEFENTTSLEAPKSIVNSGKIYVKDQFLFINEPNEGFHVFDNSNPENPIKIAFIKALGSTDMTIKGDVIYINNATDLIAVKPNFDDSTIEVTKRIANTFPQLSSPDGFNYYNAQNDEIIINWIETN